MARFLNGPAKGVSMDLRRCPNYLRLVNVSLGRSANAPRRGWDGLDQPDDEPHGFEDWLEVYRLKDGTFGQTFACVRGKGGAASSGAWESGDYLHVPLGDELRWTLRSRPAFLTWVMLAYAGDAEEGILGVGPQSIATATACALLGGELTAFDFRRLAELVGGVEVDPDVWKLRAATVPA